MTNLASSLAVAAALYPERPALRLDELTLTYRELDELASRACGLLGELGVGRGDRVGLMLPNVASFPPLYYGILRLGAVVVPMNPLLRAREIAHYVGDSGMVALFAHAAVNPEDLRVVGHDRVVITVDDGGMLAEIRCREPGPPVSETADDDTAVILYTSGTTGSPKGAELTHRNLHLNARVAAELLSLTSRDVVMGCLPLFHAFGQSSAMNAAVSAGALLTLVPRFEPAAVLSVIARDGVTVFEGVPTMYSALLGAAGDRGSTGSLRLCASGGASLPGEVHRRFKATFGASILEGYGLSETSPTATFNLPDDAKVGSIGKPIPGVELALFDEHGAALGPGEVGEIAIRGHNVMKGYWNRPEATSDAIRAGWFHTGDLATVDDDGHYFIVDRKKEVIIRGGLNVYPREVEDVLYEHPAVLEAAVIGVPDEFLGEEVAAAVALRPGREASAEEVREFVRERVAPYKYPRVLWFVDALPKGATGKILKREIEPPDDVRSSPDHVRSSPDVE